MGEGKERAWRAHREGEGEVARASAGAALVAPEHGGILGVSGAPGAGLRARAARHREFLGLGRFRPLRDARQLG